LGDVVVEGEDGAGEVEGRVEGVGEVVGEGEVGWGRRGVDAFALGEAGGVDIFLLERVSGSVWLLVADLLLRGFRLVDQDSSSSRS
jgi:hypothetical protein